MAWTHNLRPPKSTGCYSASYTGWNGPARGAGKARRRLVVTNVRGLSAGFRAHRGGGQ
jgi:hypothetical protein